jgi:predicted nuclease with TOPRIM domain
MSAQEQLEAMQKEWRNEVRDRFDKLDEALRNYNDRVSKLENNQSKLFGALIVLQGIGTWIVSKIFNTN